MSLDADREGEVQGDAQHRVVQLPPPPPTFSRETAMKVALRSFSEGAPPLLPPKHPDQTNRSLHFTHLNPHSSIKQPPPSRHTRFSHTPIHQPTRILFPKTEL